MSSRIGAALSNSVAPISSSSKHHAVERRSEDSATPKHQEKKPKEQNLKLVTTPEQETKTPVKPTELENTQNLGITSTFLQLIYAIQRHKGSVMRWLGTQTYQMCTRRQKKAGKLRKGTMLDEKVE